MKKLKDWDDSSWYALSGFSFLVAVLFGGVYVFTELILCKGLYDHKFWCKPSSNILILSIVLIVIFYIVGKIVESAKHKAKIDSVVRSVKVYTKALVLSKDKTTHTSGNSDNISTSVSYTTTARVNNHDNIYYFYDATTYNECFEGEEIAIMILEQYDKDDNLVFSTPERLGRGNIIDDMRIEYGVLTGIDPISPSKIRYNDIVIL